LRQINVHLVDNAVKFTNAGEILLRVYVDSMADHTATHRNILLQTLHGWKMRPKAVAGWISAIPAMHDSLRRRTPYDLVIVDGRIPEMDGLEATT